MTSLSITQTVPASNTQSIARQLKAASVATIGFSLMIGLGSHPSTDWSLRTFGDFIFLPIGNPASELTNEARLLAAILGGIMTGFGLFVWMLTNELIAERPLLLRKVILRVMAVWFVVDSTGSFAAGAWVNVIANVGFLAMFVLPALRLK